MNDYQLFTNYHVLTPYRPVTGFRPLAKNEVKHEYWDVQEIVEIREGK